MIENRHFFFWWCWGYMDELPALRGRSGMGGLNNMPLAGCETRFCILRKSGQNKIKYAQKGW